jgi:hypothetical protein
MVRDEGYEVAGRAPVTFIVRSERGAPSLPPGITFRGDWETGDMSQWSLVQYEFDRAIEDNIAVVTSPVRQGRYAARFVTRQGYGPYGYNESAEVVQGEKVVERPGTEGWFAWSTLFPEDWKEPYGWGIFFQLYPLLSDVYSIGCPPVLFVAREDTATVRLCTGNIDSGYGEYKVNHPLLDSLSKGHWNDFVVHVRWSHDWTGVFEVWHRVPGVSDWVKKVEVLGVPTTQYMAAHGPAEIIIKQGLYRKSYCGQGLIPVVTTEIYPDCPGGHMPGTQPANVVYQDAAVRGDSFGAVAAELDRVYP